MAIDLEAIEARMKQDNPWPTARIETLALVAEVKRLRNVEERLCLHAIELMAAVESKDAALRGAIKFVKSTEAFRPVDGEDKPWRQIAVDAITAALGDEKEGGATCARSTKAKIDRAYERDRSTRMAARNTGIQKATGQ